jgi:enoyl-CoA hydratase
VEHIKITQQDAVRRIILNRPDKLNAMPPSMQEDFLRCIDDAAEDTDTSVVVVSGAGRAFSSGADLKAAAAKGGDSTSNAPVDMILNRQRVEKLLHLWSFPKPLIAQVHGYCIGNANEIVGAADLVVCGESTKIGMPEAREFALPPTLGFWPARLGLSRTKELLFTGRWLSGAEAVQCGLAIAVVPDDDLESYVDALAAKVAEVPSAILAVCKQAVNEWAEVAGLRTAALRGAEYHAIFHQASTWAKKLAEAAGD